MLGIIGGTGLGEALFGQAFVREHDVDTPFGSPSSKVRIVSWEGTELAVLTRHGDGHLLAPSQVPYRANMCCALVAFATDYDCWRPHPEHVTRQALLAEILGHVRAATENAVTLLRHAIANLAAQGGGGCACQSALELGIWSRRDRIPKATIEHYGPLVSKYLGRT